MSNHAPQSEDSATDAPPGGAAGEVGQAIVLVAIAGYVDATAFVRFGGVFVSFASGNSTRLAALPALGHAGGAALAAGILALFVMGVFAGRLVHEAAGVWRRPALLSLSALLLLAAALAGQAAAAAPAALSLAAMTLAMGMLNGVQHTAAGAPVAATYVTGVLVHLGQGLADAAMGRNDGRWAVFLLNWLGLVLGAAVGAALALRLGTLALVLPAAAAALMGMIDGGLVRRAAAGRAS